MSYREVLGENYRKEPSSQEGQTIRFGRGRGRGLFGGWRRISSPNQGEHHRGRGMAPMPDQVGQEPNEAPTPVKRMARIAAMARPAALRPPTVALRLL
jgi:hypothetical protein